MRVLLMAAAFVALGSEYGQAKTRTELRNTTVLIVRHAEKPAHGEHLSPAGVRRAQAYPGFFKSFTLDSHRVKIDHLFATRKSAHSDRPRGKLCCL